MTEIRGKLRFPPPAIWMASGEPSLMNWRFKEQKMLWPNKTQGVSNHIPPADYLFARSLMDYSVIRCELTTIRGIFMPAS